MPSEAKRHAQLLSLASWLDELETEVGRLSGLSWDYSIDAAQMALDTARIHVAIAREHVADAIQNDGLRCIDRSEL